MNVAKTPGRIHPLLAAASVSVILVSLIGVAAMTGILPTSHSTPAPAVTPEAPVAAVEPAASKPAPELAEAPAPKPAPQARQHRSASAGQTRHTTPRSTTPITVAAAPSICASCGRIEAVDAIRHEAKPSGGGAVAGAIIGGVLGNQVGSGNGRKLATVAGAVGGGFAGNAIEKNTRATTTYDVRVRMEDGSVRTFSYSAPPGLNAGDRVRVVNGVLTAEG